MATDVRRGRGADALEAVETGLLYERYSSRILAYCMHALRDRAAAEDAVQTTFLNAHRALQLGAEPEHEFAWLHTIATNVCRMQKRTAARRAYVTGVDLDTLPSNVQADDRELGGELADALASLPESQRRALLLREWRGLTSEEVASQLGLSAPATYALLTRARRSAAQALTVARRPLAGLNFGPVVLRLKALFAGSVSTVATTTAVVAVAAGGVAVERSLGAPAEDARDDSGGAVEPRAQRPTARIAGTVRFAPSVHPTRQSVGPRWGGDRSGESDTGPSTPDEAAPAAEAPTSVPPETTSGGSSETVRSGDGSVASAVEGVVDTTLGLVPEVPVPEVEVDSGVVTEAVPGEPLPSVDDDALTDPVQVPPLPPLSPLP